MWLTTFVALLAMTGGLLDFCLERLDDQLSRQVAPPEGYNELDASISIFDPGWSTERQVFSALPDPANPDPGALVDIYGGSGTFLTAEPGSRPTFDVVNFEFWAGSSGGSVEYVDPSEVVDCDTGDRLRLPGEAALLVHFDSAHRDDRFGGNPVDGSIVAGAWQTCDHDGILEWVIAVESRNPFEVDSSWTAEESFEYGVVSVSVLR